MSLTPTPDLTQPTAAPRVSLRPRRTLNRLAWALVGVAFCAAGQYFFLQESLWDGLLFYGVGMLLFLRALGGRLPYPPLAQMEAPPIPDLRAGWRRYGGLSLIALAVAASASAYGLFGATEGEAIRRAWWTHAASLGLFVAGGLLLTRGDSWRAEAGRLFPTRRIFFGLALIVGLALALRLYNFYEQPFGIWYDEAIVGLHSRQILEDPNYRPIFLHTPINHPVHLPVIYALVLDWLGDNIYSMRLVSVFWGVGGVLAAYLFGREVRGPRFGLALAFLVAVARWHINFSRIAMNGIDVSFFEFLTLFFLVRLLRRGHLRDVMWVGLSVGAGLMFYTPFRLYVFTLLIFAPAWFYRQRRTLWPGGLARLAMLGAAGWLVVMPVVHFALHNAEIFWFRTQQASIFTRRDEPNLGKAIWQSASKHLLMFNYEGDHNGRHNLPNAPMLDPATGMLAVLGFGLALVGVRRSGANGFFLLLFPVALAGGTLSVDFEAPQSLRSISVMPAIFYFAALGMAALGREAEQALAPLPRIWVAGPAAVAAGFMLYANAHTYFVLQANDFAAWNSFSAPETITGQKMAELGPGHTYFLSPFLTNHPTLQFLAPEATNQHHLSLPDALPVREPPHKPVAIFIHPDDARIFEEAKRLYPSATFEVARSPATPPSEEGQPSVYFVGLTPGDLASIQGLELRYWPADADENEPPLQMSRTPTVSAFWPEDSPLPENFRAEWSGVLFIPNYGPYSFRLLTPGPGRLEIDGNTVLEGAGEQLTGLPLAQGNHTLRVQAAGAPGEVALFWQPPGMIETIVPQWMLYTPPVAAHGLKGTFYPNARWEGQPAFQRIDPFLDTYFHLLPLQRPYTVEWVGALDVPQSGLYRLGLRAITEAELWFDGQLLVKTAAPDRYTDMATVLEVGRHDLKVRFKDDTDRSQIHLLWIPPGGGPPVPIPSEQLWPPLGRYPDKAPPPAQTTFEAKTFTLTWQATLGGPGQFNEPRDVATLSDGRLVVADTLNRRVQILDAGGNFLHSLTGGDDVPFEEPVAVVVNSRDEILILDSTLQWIYRYDAGGNLLGRFAGPTAHLFHPRGMALFGDDSLAVADTGMSRLALFSADGTQTGNVGGLGSGPGQFNEPTDVLRDAQGTYFVAEAMNSRIQRVDQAGNPISQWAIPSAYAYDGPHLAFAPDGSIWMTDPLGRALLRYAPDGTALEQWQNIGPVNLATPVGLHFDTTTNRLYVTDVEQHQVYVFAVQVE